MRPTDPEAKDAQQSSHFGEYLSATCDQEIATNKNILERKLKCDVESEPIREESLFSSLEEGGKKKLLYKWKWYQFIRQAWFIENEEQEYIKTEKGERWSLVSSELLS